MSAKRGNLSLLANNYGERPSYNGNGYHLKIEQATPEQSPATLDPARASSVAKLLMEAEQRLIDLGVTDYTKDPGKLSNVEGRRALLRYQLVRHTFRSITDDHYRKENEKLVEYLPHSD